MKNQKPHLPGTLFVISAPSGAGKTTLIRSVLPKVENLSYSVSHTTRVPREGEINGKDYFFVTEQEFISLIDQNMMLEWAKVHGNYYGTSLAFVRDTLKNGANLILDIDVQGAKQVMTLYPDCVSIFIMPPSMKTLRQRLEQRGTDAPDVIETRLKNAEEEMAQKDLYSHVLVNDQLEQAISDLYDIFQGKTP